MNVNEVSHRVPRPSSNIALCCSNRVHKFDAICTIRAHACTIGTRQVHGLYRKVCLGWFHCIEGCPHIRGT